MTVKNKIKFSIEEEDFGTVRGKALNIWVRKNPHQASGINFPATELVKLKKCIDDYLKSIDQEPEDENAINYADGTKLDVGDYLMMEDVHIGEIGIKNGIWYYMASAENGFEEYPLLWYEDIIWDGNSMINVEKVEK